MTAPAHGPLGATLTATVKAVLTGTQEHRREARDLFARMGWDILAATQEAGEEGRTDLKATYTLILPLAPDGGRHPQLRAAEAVMRVADDAHLDLQPLTASVSGAQRKQQPHWFVHEPPVPQSGRVARWWSAQERRFGFHDTGTVVFGSRAEAEALAGTGRVRPPFPHGGAHDRLPRVGAVPGRCAVLAAVALSWAAGAMGIPLASGPWWPAVPAMAACILLTRLSAIAMRPLARPGGWPPWAAALVTSGVFLSGTLVLVRVLGPAEALGVHLLVAGLLIVPPGIRRLVALEGARKPFLTAAAVAVLPVLVTTLGGLDPVLFTFYGAQFDVRAEEMDVAKVWQLVASVHIVLTASALSLLLLSLWGYGRSLFRDDTLRLLIPVLALIGSAALVLPWTWIVADHAEASGRAAVQQWRAGHVPDHYFGAEPEPVCVSPVVPAHDLPLYGHRLDPRQVYGAFGVVDGEVTLWDPASGDAFSVASDSVQVLPAGGGEPGSAIPRTCDSRD
ncbi:hypothetical protein ACGFZL_04330 [Streptomyces sp. NPDC048182]|uniref:hypothetical protein n=1 Tax=Streptomyces sp. NPDC048182 TaxID=3365507 RepID=UPI0037109471